MMFRHQLLTHIGLAIAIVICVAIPASVVVVIKSLWSSLTTDLGFAAAFRLVLGATPTSIYLVAPVACIVTTCWLFRLNSINGALPAMYAAGTSVGVAAVPAVLLALLFTLASTLGAWIVAPRGVTMVENVKYDLKRNIDIDALEEGRFHSLELDNSTATLFFRRDPITKYLTRVVLHLIYKDKTELTITARYARVRKDDGNLIILFRSGNRQTLGKGGKPVFVEFESHAIVLPLPGTLSSASRTGKTLLEMNYRELVNVLKDKNETRRYIGKAKSELAKRFLAPPMSLAHTLLVIGILFSFGPVRTLWRRVHIWVAVGLVTAHISAVSAIETLARDSAFVTWSIAIAIVAELFLGSALLWRSDSTLRAMRMHTFARLSRIAPQR